MVLLVPMLLLLHHQPNCMVMLVVHNSVQSRKGLSAGQNRTPWGWCAAIVLRSVEAACHKLADCDLSSVHEAYPASAYQILSRVSLE